MDVGEVTDTDHNLPQDLAEFIVAASVSEDSRHSFTGWDIEASLASLSVKKRDRRSLFEDNDDEEDVDLNGWRNKRPELWGTRDTKNWLLSAAGKLGLMYSDISPELVMPGENLLLLSRKDFLSYDRRFGEKLYDFLQRVCDSEYSIDSYSDHRHSQKGEKSKGTKYFKKRKRNNDGQMRRRDCKRSKTAAPKIWEFVRNLLFDRRYCPEFIRWENHNEKTFRFVKSREIARIWGSRNRNENMDFEKFSRALRYYYKKDILQPVPDHPLVYRFGPKAEGLETDNPNF